MASIVAYIDVREGIVTAPTRFLLAEARRVADQAGATVYALLAIGPLDHRTIDHLAGDISAGGADRVLCSAGDRLSGPPLDATHGQLLRQVAEHLRPILFLFPAGGVGVELGPPLAVRMGAAYVANARIDVRSEKSDLAPASQRVVLTRWRAARDARRKIDVGDLERPVVAILASGRASRPQGRPCADVEMLPCPEAGFPDVRLVGSDPLPESAVDLCSALVCSASAVDAAALAALEAALPSGTALIGKIDDHLAAIQAARPSDILILSAKESVDPTLLPAPVPGCSVSLVGLGPSEDIEDALRELASALRRARHHGEGTV